MAISTGQNQNQVWLIVLTALALGSVVFFLLVLLLQPVFSGSVVLQQVLQLGSVQIRYYGVLLALAAAAGYWLALKRRQSYGITRQHAEAVAFLMIASGFIGARLYHVISELPFYLQNPGQVLAVWNGGLSIFGAMLGGLIGLVIYKRFHQSFNVSLPSLLDWLTPSLLIGQIIGRFGNFVNYEIYGTPTNLPWKMFVPASFRQTPFEAERFFHPLFLYEAVGCAVILYLVIRLKLKGGQLFLLWLLLYNVMRFFLEQLRVGSVIHFGVRFNALVAAGLTLVAAYLWFGWFRARGAARAS
jgi:phosphatidylglycerol---prolipoprotein diacylglyceryl transferase